MKEPLRNKILLGGVALITVLASACDAGGSYVKPTPRPVLGYEGLCATNLSDSASIAESEFVIDPLAKPTDKSNWLQEYESLSDASARAEKWFSLTNDRLADLKKPNISQKEELMSASEATLGVINFFLHGGIDSQETETILSMAWQSPVFKQAMKEQLYLLQNPQKNIVTQVIEAVKPSAFLSDFSHVYASQATDPMQRYLDLAYCKDVSKLNVKISQTKWLDQKVKAAFDGKSQTQVVDEITQVTQENFGIFLGSEDQAMIEQSVLSAALNFVAVDDDTLKQIMTDTIYEKLMQGDQISNVTGRFEEVFNVGMLNTKTGKKEYNGKTLESETLVMAFARILAGNLGHLTRFPSLGYAKLETEYFTQIETQEGISVKKVKRPFEATGLISTTQLLMPQGAATNLESLASRLEQIKSNEALLNEMVHDSRGAQSLVCDVYFPRTSGSGYTDEPSRIELDNLTSKKQFLGVAFIASDDRNFHYIPVVIAKKMDKSGGYVAVLSGIFGSREADIGFEKGEMYAMVENVKRPLIKAVPGQIMFKNDASYAMYVK